MRRAPIVALPCRLAILVAALVLTACNNPFADEAPTLNEILNKGWIGSGLAAEEPANLAPLYCYGTIARADCYDAPLPGQNNRLVGFEGPRPPEYDEL